MNLRIAAQSPAQRLLEAPPAQAGGGDAPTLPEAHDSLLPHALQATAVVRQAAVPSALETAAEVLAAGIQDITNSMVEDFKLNDVLYMILETMFRALGFRRVVFCLRDAREDALIGRFGLGDMAQEMAPRFRIPLKASGDLFAAVCLKGADTLIADATVGHIAARLPAWYREGVKPRRSCCCQCRRRARRSR